MFMFGVKLIALEFWVIQNWFGEFYVVPWNFDTVGWAQSGATLLAASTFISRFFPHQGHLMLVWTTYVAEMPRQAFEPEELVHHQAWC